MATARERDVANAVAAELRAIMARQQVKALHLSRMSGIPNATLSTLLSGNRAIDVDQLSRICQPLGVEPGWVLATALEAMHIAPIDKQIVDDVLHAETTLTERQKASIREQATGGNHPVVRNDQGKPHRKVL